MPSVTFTYAPSETQITVTPNILYGTNPVHDIVTGMVIGTLDFNYLSQPLWDPNGDTKYFNTLTLNILLNKLQNNNLLNQFNSLNATVYFESTSPLSRIPFGTKYQSSLTSTTIPLCSNANVKIFVNNDGTRIYELCF